jgi:hypothetical protein
MASHSVIRGAGLPWVVLFGNPPHMVRPSHEAVAIGTDDEVALLQFFVLGFEPFNFLMRGLDIALLQGSFVVLALADPLADAGLLRLRHDKNLQNQTIGNAGKAGIASHANPSPMRSAT